MKYKFFQTLAITGSLTASLFAQQNPSSITDDEKSGRKDILQAVNNRFSNLPVEVRKKYFAMKQDAYRFFNNKRTFESMMKLYEMVEIFDEDPQVFNLLGSIHIEFRNFDRAREIFTKALEISVEDSMLLFNLAEIEFCTSNWEESLKRFEQLEAEQKGQSETELSKLIKLKIMLCNLALADTDNNKVNTSKKSTHLASAKKLANEYSYLDDSPYYYYAQAALAFHDDNLSKANEALSSARNIFSNSPSALSSWNDTFIEFGYITSHYGLDTPAEEVDSIVE